MRNRLEVQQALLKFEKREASLEKKVNKQKEDPFEDSKECLETIVELVKTAGKIEACKWFLAGGSD